MISTWPLAAHLQTHLADHFGDGALHLWNSWWVLQALREGSNPFFTHFIFYPHGVSLVTENFAWLHIIPSLLLSPFVNPIAAFNLAVFLNLALCGVALFWLAYDLTGSSVGAFIAGLIYQMWPYRLARLDLPNMLATCWMPLFLLFLIRTLENGRRRDAVLAGICFALVGYSRWQFLIPAALMALIILFFYGVPRFKGSNRKRLFSNLLLFFVTGTLLVAPPLILLARDPSGYEELIYSDNEEVLMSADLLAFATPSQVHSTLRAYSQPLQDRYYFDREATRRRPVYLGLLPLLLSLAGLVYLRRRAWPWAIMFLLFLLLALGPVLRVNGVLYENIPAPYGLFAPLGILELIRDPERFALFLAPPVAVLAAAGLAGILAAHPRLQRWAWPLTAVLSMIIFWEYYSPQSVLRDYSHPPAFYQQLADANGSNAILNLPFDDIKTRFNMGDQTLHGHPIVQGNLSRFPAGAYSYIEGNPWLATLRHTGEMAPEFADTSRQLRRLAAEGIGYVILHKDKVGADRIAHWGQALIAQPLYEDETIIVYRTTPEVNLDFDLAPDWERGPAPVTVTLSAACVHPNHVLVVSVAWGTDQPPGSDLDARVALVDAAGESWFAADYPLVTGWPTSQWPDNALAHGTYQIALPAELPPGDYEVQLSLRESETGVPWTGAHVIGQVAVQEAICNLGQVEEAIDANSLFADQLRLVEYSVEQQEAKLKLRLYWQAERFVDNEYTVFVHLFDPQTDLPTAQNDGRPRDGAYPMRYWQPGEVVDDRIEISLADVPPGEYGVAIGVYDPVSGERLPLVDENGEPRVADGRFILPQRIRIP